MNTKLIGQIQRKRELKQLTICRNLCIINLGQIDILIEIMVIFQMYSNYGPLELFILYESKSKFNLLYDLYILMS